MAPTICSENKTQQRSGINEIRKDTKITTSLSKAPSSSLNYAQKRSKLIRPYPARGKRQIIDNSVYQISSSSDASNDTNENFHRSNSPQPSIISDNSISTSSESSLLSPLSSLSELSTTYVSSGSEDYTSCANRLKSPFYHHNIDLSSSVYTISSSDEEKNLDEDMISRSFNVIASDSQDNVTSTIEDDKTNLKSLTKLQMQQESKHTKGLFDIAIKMIKLVHRNQLLQRRLSQLQAETSQFIESVLANPENQAFRDKVQANGCCKN
ncbi:uncharacterized protein LOC129942372 [Eupeodes corollae]|uniref:uncharacterized protein LOC129942372 n=1 Tax=Eupeodes corollae TaxID=290404 RepID=UPI002493AF23|nr:uncharacterized protein LOC129942372 [Eupeodes corollae]